jgi:hypothetical protein
MPVRVDSDALLKNVDLRKECLQLQRDEMVRVHYIIVLHALAHMLGRQGFHFCI